MYVLHDRRCFPLRLWAQVDQQAAAVSGEAFVLPKEDISDCLFCSDIFCVYHLILLRNIVESVCNIVVYHTVIIGVAVDMASSLVFCDCLKVGHRPADSI